MTPLKPLQSNLNTEGQFKFELEIRKTFHTVPIRFCSRFLFPNLIVFLE